MAEKLIVDVFNIRSRFLRSASLERDFHDPSALTGYVKTEFIQECCDRLAHGLRQDSGRRAWRITGDYGCGKSSFALLVATALSGRDGAQRPQLVRAFDYRKLGIKRPAYLPVLVTCSREPLGKSILSALLKSISRAYRRGMNPRAAECVQRLLSGRAEPTDTQIVDAILDANAQLIADNKAEGLLMWPCWSPPSSEPNQPWQSKCRTSQW